MPPRSMRVPRFSSPGQSLRRVRVSHRRMKAKKLKRLLRRVRDRNTRRKARNEDKRAVARLMRELNGNTCKFMLNALWELSNRLTYSKIKFMHVESCAAVSTLIKTMRAARTGNVKMHAAWALRSALN